MLWSLLLHLLLLITTIDRIWAYDNNQGHVIQVLGHIQSRRQFFAQKSFYLPCAISGRAGQLFTIFCIFLVLSETQLTPWKKTASHHTGTKGAGSDHPPLFGIALHTPQHHLPMVCWDHSGPRLLNGCFSASKPLRRCHLLPCIKNKARNCQATECMAAILTDGFKVYTLLPELVVSQTDADTSHRTACLWGCCQREQSWGSNEGKFRGCFSWANAIPSTISYLWLSGCRSPVLLCITSLFPSP